MTMIGVGFLGFPPASEFACGRKVEERKVRG
jgi:hypothetical protein